MECSICMRPPGSRLRFCCPSCARNILYEPRLRNAKILLEKERLASQIEQIHSLVEGADGKPRAGAVEQDADASRRWSIETSNIKRAHASNRTSDMQEHIQILRDEIKTARQEITERKAGLWKRRSEMDAVKAAVPERWTAESDKVKEMIKKTSESWDAVHDNAAETRNFLCRETAHLYGLRQRRKMRGGVVGEQYTIGGTPVFNLKEINSAKANELTTSLNNTAHLVVLVSFYLSLRLPAEITLPHRNYPLPTIFAPAYSYQGREIPFAAVTPTPSLLNSPVASRHTEQGPLPRPRPLFIEPENLKDKIPAVAKGDPITFSFFLEGMSLLAWDIAWLCRSQGLYNGTESWEEVCNIGQNLWNLLVAPSQSTAVSRGLSGRDVRQRSTGGPDTTLTGPPRSLGLGHFSHGSAHSFSDSGADFLLGWKLTKYTMVMDPLKRALIGEMSNAEWEMLEQEEWDDGGEQFGDDQAVFIRHNGSGEMAGRSSLDDARSIMTARTERRSEDRENREDQADTGKELPTTDAAGSGRIKGTSGWTKLKNREK